jgi:hypothetical protein
MSRDLTKPLDVRPPACVLQAFTDAAVTACDELDGVKDGIITLPGQCLFDATSIVGQTVSCTAPNETIEITEKMAELVNLIWDGASSVDVQFEWYGMYNYRVRHIGLASLFLIFLYTTSYFKPLKCGWKSMRSVPLSNPHKV